MAARSMPAAAKKGSILAADHAVLHAAGELIADLPRGHDGLRGQRRRARPALRDESARAAARLELAL